MILPILVIIFTLLFGVGLLIYLKKGENKNSEKDSSKKSAQDFTNVRNIKDGILYTLDGYSISYLKIYPISINLFSEQEIINITKNLTSEFSAEKEMFKFLAISRPVDIAAVTEKYQELIKVGEIKQKELLRKELKVLNDYALSGEIFERQFYLMFWQKTSIQDSELTKKMEVVKERFDSASIKTELIEEKEIIRLCNLFNNPAYVQVDDLSYDLECTIPIMKEA